MSETAQHKHNQASSSPVPKSPVQHADDEHILPNNAEISSPSLNATQILALQRTVGNRAVQRLVKGTTGHFSKAPQRIQRTEEEDREKIDSQLGKRQSEELTQLNLDSPVKRFLASAQKDMLEKHLAAPKLTGNARDALKLAEEVAKRRHDEDKRAVEERITALGVDLHVHPNAYDLCAAYIRNKQLTINFGTHLLGILFSNKDYVNMWNRSSTNSDPNYAAGRDLTERTLHGLPTLDSEVGTIKKPGQKLAQDLLSERGGLESDSHKESDEEAKQAVKLQAIAAKPTLDDLRNEFEEWEEENPDSTVEEYVAKLDEVYDSNWLEWYYNTREDKEGTGTGNDRPISSGVNMSQYRGGSAPAYGTTHIVLKDSVKERSTVTGQDSKDLIYEKGMGPGAVGTFNELGPVMRYMEQHAFKRLVDLAVLGKDPTSVKGEVGYIEAQIFGGIDLTRDVEKIVVDEDDLDLWQEGKLLIDPLLGAGTRPAQDTTKVKALIIAFGEKHNIPVQFIRSGKDKNRPGHVSEKNKAVDKLAVIQPWQTTLERALNAFKNKQWVEGMNLANTLGKAADKPSGEVSHAKMGLSNLESVKEEAKKTYEKRAKLRTLSQNPLYVPNLLSELAGRILTVYYQSPVKEAYMNALRRISIKALNYLSDTVAQAIQKWD